MTSDAEQLPILFLKVFDKGKEIYNGTLKLNDTVMIDDKYLGFYDIKYWSNFYVVKDDGTNLVYAGIGSIIQVEALKFPSSELFNIKMFLCR